MQYSLWDLPAYICVSVCVCVPTVVKWACCCCSLRWSPLLVLCHWVHPLKACCQWVARKRREKLSSSSVTLYPMSHITLSVIPPSLSLFSFSLSPSFSLFWFCCSPSLLFFFSHPILNSPKWLSSCPSPSFHFHLFSLQSHLFSIRPFNIHVIHRSFISSSLIHLCLLFPAYLSPAPPPLSPPPPSLSSVLYSLPVLSVSRPHHPDSRCISRISNRSLTCEVTNNIRCVCIWRAERNFSFLCAHSLFFIPFSPAAVRWYQHLLLLLLLCSQQTVTAPGETWYRFLLRYNLMSKHLVLPAPLRGKIPWRGTC